MQDLAAFARLIGALRPWLGELVLVGGWAHRMHRLHPTARPPEYAPLTTRDADLAFSDETALRGSVREALHAAGFREELFGDDSPPATHYRLGEEDAGFYAEFLAPLHGSGVKRTGRRDATISKAGITAQKLRYVEILLVEPWMIEIGRRNGVPLSPVATVRIPNPVSFMVQKLLIYSDRPPAKRAQDILYIHDTLELFGASLGELRHLWENSVRQAIASKTAKRVGMIASELFEAVSDPIREAARIPQDRSLRPEYVRGACQKGLDAVLAGV